MVVQLRRATVADVEEITAAVAAAYGHYVARIGQQPGPMREDYARRVAECEVWVAQLEARVAGTLVLKAMPEGFLLDNVAVHPEVQGQGIGRALIELAEARARAAGYDSIYLYTHEQMTENQVLYQRIGYVAYVRRIEDGLARIFMRKVLGRGQSSPRGPAIGGCPLR